MPARRDHGDFSIFFCSCNATRQVQWTCRGAWDDSCSAVATPKCLPLRSGCSSVRWRGDRSQRACAGYSGRALCAVCRAVCGKLQCTACDGCHRRRRFCALHAAAARLRVGGVRWPDVSVRICVRSCLRATTSPRLSPALCVACVPPRFSVIALRRQQHPCGARRVRAAAPLTRTSSVVR